MFPQISRTPIWIYRSILSPVAPESPHQRPLCICLAEYFAKCKDYHLKSWLHVLLDVRLQPFWLVQPKGCLWQIIVLKQNLVCMTRAEAPHPALLTITQIIIMKLDLVILLRYNLYTAWCTHTHAELRFFGLVQGSFTYSVVRGQTGVRKYQIWIVERRSKAFQFQTHSDPVSPWPQSGTRWLPSWIYSSGKH